MSRLILLCALFLVTLPALAAIYRWTDEQGNVHFGDEPVHGAEPVDPGQPTVVDSVEPRAQGNATQSPAESSSDSSGYRRFVITSPESEATLRGNPGRVEIAVAVEPRLRKGDRIEVSLDGRPLPGSPSDKRRYTVSDVERGEHRLRASVVDDEGRVQAETGPRVFYMHRPSVNLPANPN